MSQLQLRIWKFAIPGPRLLEIQRVHKLKSMKYTTDKGEASHATWLDKFQVACADTLTVLHVCRVAREEALKVYRLVLGNHLTHPVYIAAYDKIMAGNDKGNLHSAAKICREEGIGHPTAENLTVEFLSQISGTMNIIRRVVNAGDLEFLSPMSITMDGQILEDIAFKFMMSRLLLVPNFVWRMVGTRGLAEVRILHRPDVDKESLKDWIVIIESFFEKVAWLLENVGIWI